MSTAASTPPDARTVPPELVGRWRRSWIEFADGSHDDTSVVVWLQLDREMADLRLPADRGTVSSRRSLDECSLDELRALTACDSSSGITICSPIVTGDDGTRRATASWTDGEHGVAFQPVSAFPEPGLLEWVADEADGSHVCRAGSAAIVVRNHPAPLAATARLDELASACGDDRESLTAQVDCEFSFAMRCGDRFVVEASTLPWREGAVVDVDLR